MEKVINIGGRLHNPVVGGAVTGANEIKDDTKGKMQNVINTETDAELVRLDEEKQEKLTFDQTPTENSTNPVTSGGVYAADAALQQAIEAILLLIPSAASALNQLADKSFVNSSIATATATFRGTYNLVTDLGLTVSATHPQIATALASEVSTADNNDYCFVQIPVSDQSQLIRVTERYKFNGTTWSYEYDLNNSGFTADQWAAINSGITTLLVTKLGALPTAAELATMFAGKQNTLTFDTTPVNGSANPVTSGGLYAKFAAIEAMTPSDADANNKLVAENRLVAYVATVIGALDASYNITSADGHVTFKLTQADGTITSVQILTDDIASAAALTTLGGRVSTAEADIDALQAAYSALTQSDVVIVEGALPSSGQQQNIIYRQPDQDHTPPQFYSDYMWNGTTWVLMAAYMNGIDPRPKKGSQNLVTSGGVFDNMGALDVSELNATENPHTLARYVDLSAALAAIPSDYQKGGMSIKFVQSSDNKYVQARCMAQNFTTDVTQWQGVDDGSLIGYDFDLMTKNSIYSENTSIVSYISANYRINTNGNFSSDSTKKHIYIPVSVGEKYHIDGIDSYVMRVAFATSKNATSGGAVPVVSGTSVYEIPANENIWVRIPESCTYLLVWRNDVDSGFNIKKAIGIDEEPTEGSKNLVKSGGVFDTVEQLYKDVSSLSIEVNGNVIIEPTVSDILTGNLASGGLWSVNEMTGSVIIEIPIAYRGKKITAVSNFTSKQYAFLAEYGGSENYAKSTFCTGCQRENNYPNNATIPEDCNYLYLLVKNGETATLPTVLVGNFETGLAEQVNDLELEIEGNLITQPIAENVLSGNLLGAGTWSASDVTASLIVDLSNYRGRKITVTSPFGSKQYAFLSAFGGTSQGAQSTFCQGCQRESTYPEEVTIPQDCNYIYILVKNNSPIILPYIKISGTQEGLADKIKNIETSLLRGDKYVIWTGSKFEIYQKLHNSDYYSMLEIIHDVDNSDTVYLDVWRLKTNGGIYEFDGHFFNSKNIRLLNTPENEFAFKYVGASDYTGGWHGDERIDVDNSCYIKFILDGIELSSADLASPFSKWCNTFKYEQRSTLHQTSPTEGQYVTGHPIIAYHLKITDFKNGGYTTINRMDLDLSNTELSEIVTEAIFTGLVCIHKDTSAVVSVDTGNFISMVGEGNTYNFNGVSYPLSIMLLYNGFNTTTKASSKVISKEITKPNEGHNVLAVWDRTNDSKYYGYAPNRTFETGDIFMSEMEVSFDYKAE